MPGRMPLTPRLALLLSVPPLLWAGNAVVGRLVIDSVGPLLLNALRWLLAFVLLLPLGWRAFASAPRRAQIRARLPYLLLLAATGVGAYNALQYQALRTSTPLNVTLIAASSPVWAMLVGAVFYRERPSRHQVAGALLSLAGVAVVLGRGELAALARVQFVAGDLLMLLAVAIWSFYSWMLARPPAHMQGAQRPSWDWAEFLCVQIALGLVFALGAAGAEHALAATPAPPLQWSPLLLAALAYVAIGPSLLAYRLWGLGVVEGGAAMAAFFSNLTPLFAAVLSTLMLGEGPRAYHGAAFALIVAGIVVSSRR